tara:strand:+ start:4568 stop:5983 length:1416 start_codon:yes stop_codon:yes gene_type:complete
MRHLKTLTKITLSLLSLFIINACSDDDTTTLSGEPFVVAFENLSANLSDIENTVDINLIYSEIPSQQGTVIVQVESTNAIYGQDFTTVPAMEGNNITLSIAEGESNKVITFNKLNPGLDESVEIEFSIIEIDYPNAQIQGNTTFSLNSTASLGRGFEPTVGGPNQPNQVYIDLSTEDQSQVKRDSWDLSFYSGNEFRVGINGSIYMAAAQLEATDIDAISEADVVSIQEQVAVGTFDPTNVAYIDYPDGNISRTAIDEISFNDTDNKVYLVNLGYEVGTENPEPGSVAIAGNARGWKKIRILRQGDNYLLQYANLNDSSHQEVVIEKEFTHNFTFFSFDSDTTVSVEPTAENWDINFTVFTNIIDGAGSYGFSDGVLHNRNGGVVAYAVFTEDFSYDSFELSNVVNSSFSQDQRIIGSTWRDVINEDKTLVDNIFYVIKDSNGNVYKLKFTALLNNAGERGYPKFKYNLLQ